MMRRLAAWQDSCCNTHLHVADKGDIKPAGQQQVKAIYELSGDEGEAAELMCSIFFFLLK